jgi:phenylpyruvate tautomerase PptA (4-oxalocrotonate tautomerase family)
LGQVKIFGIWEQLHPIREKMSAVIHNCVVEAFQYPREKKAHRFIYIEADSFFYFDSRSEKHTIIEINLFEGRSVEAKKNLIYALFEKFETELGIKPIDLEITLIESPKHNWGIRGKTGDELLLNYKVEI